MQNLSKLTGVPPDVKFVIFKFCFFKKYSDICQTPHEILAGGISQFEF